jgi:hypothetical protein
LNGGFNFSMTTSNGSSWSWSQTHNSSNTSQSTSSAGYSITGPQASDNYTGPAVFDVYTDNVYGTFAFYSNEQRQSPPIQINPIGVTALANFGTVQVGHASTTQQITLTNNSIYPLTMVAPAVTFSDPGFQIVPGTDNCSNVQLNPYGTAPYTCTLSVEFLPVSSDAPNTILASYPIHANVLAGGTENISSWQNILVTSTGILASATATPSATTTGTTLLPATYQFPTAPNTGGTAPAEQQVLTFKNYYSASITLGATEVALTDSVNFSVLSDGCASQTIVSGGSCSFTLQYLPKTALPSTGIFTTKVTISGIVVGQTVTPIPLVYAGASGTILGTVGLAPNPTHFNVTLYRSGSSLPTGWAVPITLSNNTSYPVGSWVFNACPNGVNGGNNATCGRLTANFNDGVTTNCPTTLMPAQSCTAEGMYSTADVGLTGNFTGIISATGTVVTTGSPKLTAQVNTTVTVTAVNAVKPTIVIHGTEQSQTVTQPAKPGKTDVTISGAVAGSFTGNRYLALTISGFRVVAAYTDTATPLSIAKALAAAANVSGSPVTAQVNGSVVRLTSKVTGAAGNLSYTTSNTRDFAIAPNQGALTGGTDAVTKTVYDGGTLSASVGTVTALAKWSKGSTRNTIASALTSSLNTAGAGVFTATVSGNTITITLVSNSGGSPPPVTVDVKDSMGFSPASFAASTGS